jgi:hypothetical protein
MTSSSNNNYVDLYDDERADEDNDEAEQSGSDYVMVGGVLMSKITDNNSKSSTNSGRQQIHKTSAGSQESTKVTKNHSSPAPKTPVSVVPNTVEISKENVYKSLKQKMNKSHLVVFPSGLHMIALLYIYNSIIHVYCMNVICTAYRRENKMWK